MKIKRTYVFTIAMMIFNYIMANDLKCGDVFEYTSGENTLFCQVKKECSDTKGEVNIIKQLNTIKYPAENYYTSDKEPKGKLIIQDVVTDPNGKEYNVISIEASAFSTCKKITEVEINCREIGSYSFSKCDQLNKITIGDNVKSLKRGAFFRCAIKSVNLNKITDIQLDDIQPFTFCENLEEIYVPDSNDALVAIDNVLFTKDMSHLITFPSSVDFNSWQGFPSQLTAIQQGAFINLNAEKLTIPSILGNKSDSYISAFINSTIEVLWVNGNNIPTSAFSNSTIKQIHIGADVKKLHGSCFFTYGLKDIYLYGTELPEMDSDNFCEDFCFHETKDVTLHVRPGYNLPSKIAADYHKWAVFTNVVEDITAVPTEVSIPHLSESSISNQNIYTLSGHKSPNCNRGIKIINGKKVLMNEP